MAYDIMIPAYSLSRTEEDNRKIYLDPHVTMYGREGSSENRTEDGKLIGWRIYERGDTFTKVEA